jgi:hypothetical protein
VLNVDDIKSQEVDTDFWARLAWNVEGFGPASQTLYQIEYREDIVRGLENAPDGLMGLLQGKNFDGGRGAEAGT